VTRCRGQRRGRRHDQAQEGRTKVNAPSFRQSHASLSRNTNDRCRQTTTLRLCLRALKHVGDLHRRPRSAAGCRDAAGVQGAGRRPLVAHSRTAFACDRKQTRSALRRRSENGFGQPAAIGSCRTRDGRRQEPRRSVCRKSAAAGPRNPKSRSEQPERHSRRIEQARYSDRTRQGMDPCAGRPCSPAGDVAGQINSGIWFDLRPATPQRLVVPLGDGVVTPKRGPTPGKSRRAS
jgi:hypothetical protein